jgi:hypothetical protein
MNEEKPVVNPEELQKPNNLGKALREWWDSETFQEIEKAHQEGLERAVGKYFMLSESDKLDMLQAVCYIMCKAEQEGTSHRGLQDALGVYPAGFWISELMDVHNALWSYYHDQKKEKELQDDLESLDKFLENKD